MDWVAACGILFPLILSEQAHVIALQRFTESIHVDTMHESEKVNLNHSKESVLGLLIIFENVYVINLRAQPLVSVEGVFELFICHDPTSKCSTR